MGGKREIISLPSAQVEVEPRADHLFVVESGQLRNLEELGRYHQAIDRVIARTGIRNAIIDARGEIGDPPVEVRDAMWAWLIDPERGLDTVAFVLPTEMAVARVNMTALSRRARIRAFESVVEARRWLARGPRFSAANTLAAPSAGRSSRSTGPFATAPTEMAIPAQSDPPPRRSPGSYHTTSTKTERPGSLARDVRPSEVRPTRRSIGAAGTSDDGGDGSQVA